ncbi:hypothetical protein FACS1894208_00730 [Clostridia bacterium]|nr:hypothetical protein FACS1894208_00730 [Clostridia bacterium]
MSDSYWVHRNGDKATFQSASPYLNDFTEYGVCVSDKSVPDAELGGSFTKCWRRDSKTGQTFIVKYMPQNMVDSERAALILAAQLELPCAKEYTAWQQPNSIAIENLTTHGKMLLPLGGKLKYGYSFRAVQGLFSQMGVAQCELILRTILFDAVVANYDRYENGSNWARMAVEANGSLSFHVSPMYDFNLAHRGTDNPYLRSIAETGIAGSSAKAILDEWQPVIAAFDDSCWLKNLTTLYKLVS